MSVSFDWDVGEPSPEPRPTEEGEPPRWRRRWRRRLFIIVGLVLIGLLVRAWVVARLKAVERQEAKLLAVVELELKALAAGDAELFRSIQDPQDRVGQERQVARYLSPNGVQFVPAPGLVPSDRPGQVKAVHLSSGGGRVELTRWYEDHTPQAIEPDGASPAPLAFNVTWFYQQREDGNWYHVEPPGDYWGLPHSWHSTRLTIRDTEREAQHTKAVAQELAVLVYRGCLWIGCPQDAVYALSFEDVLGPQIRGDVWVLPAIYLTGLPGNEAAQAAWARAVKLWTIDMLAQAQLGDPRLAQRMIYRQLAGRLQEKLGLLVKPEPRPDANGVARLARVLADRKQHPLWFLWQAQSDPSDPEATRALEVEVAALVAFLEEQVGTWRVFELLPALRAFHSFDRVLSEVFEIDPGVFGIAWATHLIDLTVVDLVPEAVVRPLDGAPELFPGEHLAFICAGRIWTANADGSRLVALTPSNQPFYGLKWSPDGHQMLTALQSYGPGPPRELYLLRADGGGGRLVTDDPELGVGMIEWGPNGRNAIYHSFPLKPIAWDNMPEIRALDLDAGESRLLPGWPVWSPDGSHLVYSTGSPGWPDRVWLANARWEDARLIAERAWLFEQAWSPDGSKLALFLPTGYSEQTAAAIYGMTTELLSSGITGADLTGAAIGYEGGYVNDGTERDVLLDRPLVWLSLWGWSADGRHLLVWARGTEQDRTDAVPVTLAAIPVRAFDEVSIARLKPRLLVFGAIRDPSVRRSWLRAAWSPVEPNRLIFTWIPGRQGDEWADAYLLDLDAGVVFSARQSWGAVWSPDGQWVAFGGRGQITITDPAGQERFAIHLRYYGPCSDLIWNPAADPSRLGETVGR